MHTLHSSLDGSGLHENRFLYRNNEERVEAFNSTLEKQGINLQNPHVKKVLENYRILMRQIANNPLRSGQEPLANTTLSVPETSPSDTLDNRSTSEPPSSVMYGEIPEGVGERAIELLLMDVLPSLVTSSGKRCAK